MEVNRLIWLIVIGCILAYLILGLVTYIIMTLFDDSMYVENATFCVVTWPLMIICAIILGFMDLSSFADDWIKDFTEKVINRIKKKKKK